MNRPLAVVKVGGSLYDLPDLGPRLQAWLKQAPAGDVLLVPGGGPTADVVRDLDRIHRLGEEKAHSLALAALRMNAHFLAMLVGGADFLKHWDENLVVRLRREGARMFLIGGPAFAERDRRLHPDVALPHNWAVTSDSIAARVAVTSGAEHLFLLKSVTIPPEMDWEEAAKHGYVDEWLARTLRHGPPGLRVRAVNLRDWRP